MSKTFFFVVLIDINPSIVHYLLSTMKPYEGIFHNLVLTTVVRTCHKQEENLPRGLRDL